MVHHHIYMYYMQENDLGLSKNSTGAIMHTAFHDATCGVVLDVKKKYITAGKTAGHFFLKNLSSYM